MKCMQYALCKHQIKRMLSNININSNVRRTIPGVVNERTPLFGFRLGVTTLVQTGTT